MYRVVYLFILLLGNIYAFSVKGTAAYSRTLSSHQVTNKFTGIWQDTKEIGVCVRVGMCVCVLHVYEYTCMIHLPRPVQLTSERQGRRK
jgi:hypothetical protein